MATFPKGFMNHLVHQDNARTIATIARETGARMERPVTQHTAADAITLRGIPAVGRGVSGVIHGTQPEAVATR